MSLVRTLLVRKSPLTDARVRASAPAPLAPGQIRVRTNRLALTANNITYAAFGDAMHYWDFFPSGEDGWGVIPLWGFGSVVQSLHPGVAVGERLYGYWPFASHAVVQPERLTAAGFIDAAAHRAALPAVYNRYMRCAADPASQHAPAHLDAAQWEGTQALLRPLFTTAWLIDDFFAAQAFFGATHLLLSSASSKTAYATAFHLREHAGIQVVGLTSPAQRAFCEGLGCYSRVLSYADLAELPADLRCAYIDFAGNADLRRQVHERFVHLAYDCSIGGTHVEQLGGGRQLPGPRATLFFAPEQVRLRSAEWGATEFGRRAQQAWQRFAQHATDARQPWIMPIAHQGDAAVLEAYTQVLAGRVPAREGLIVDLG